METQKNTNYWEVFEDVINTLLVRKPYQTQVYYAGIYNTSIVETSALLYAVCTLEINHRKGLYSEEEFESLRRLKDDLVSDENLKGNTKTQIIECLNFFQPKLDELRKLNNPT